MEARRTSQTVAMLMATQIIRTAMMTSDRLTRLWNHIRRHTGAS